MKTDIFRLVTSLVILALFVTVVVTAFGFMRRTVAGISRDPFSIEAVCAGESGEATVTVKAERRLSEGDYIILFAVYGQTSITVTDESGTEHGGWLTDHFSKAEPVHTYTVHGNPEGMDFLWVSLISRGSGSTYVTALRTE